MSRASIITAVGSNELGGRIKSDQVSFVTERAVLRHETPRPTHGSL